MVKMLLLIKVQIQFLAPAIYVQNIYNSETVGMYLANIPFFNLLQDMKNYHYFYKDQIALDACLLIIILSYSVVLF